MTNESIWEKVDSVEKRFENRLDKLENDKKR